MHHYLITGGKGFIGSRIVEKSVGQSYDTRSGLSILDKDSLERSVKGVDGIFHCAAKISVPESVQLPGEYYKVNVEGFRNVIEIAKKHGIKIVFSSSAAVYGEQSVAVKENTTLNPKSPYAENKRDGEVMLQESDIDAVSLRYFNVYGPGQSPQYAGVISAFIRNALAGKNIVIYGDGEQVRDFVYVDDVADANIAAMNYKVKGHEVFNVASGSTITIKELAQLIIGLTGSISKIAFAEPREGDIVYSAADISKIQKVLGWKAKVGIEEGLRRTIESMKN